MGQKFSMEPSKGVMPGATPAPGGGREGWRIELGPVRAVVRDVALDALDLGKLGRQVQETDVAGAPGLDIAAGAVAGFFSHVSQRLTAVQERAGAVTVAATEVFDLYDRADYEMAGQHQSAASKAGQGKTLGPGW